MFFCTKKRIYKIEIKYVVSIKVCPNFIYGRDSMYLLVGKKLQRKNLREAHD